jgi:hypothetical protein
MSHFEPLDCHITYQAMRKESLILQGDITYFARWYHLFCNVISLILQGDITVLTESQNPLSRVNIHGGTKEIVSTLRNQQLHNRAHSSPPHVVFWARAKSIHVTPSNFLRSKLISSSNQCLVLNCTKRRPKQGKRLKCRVLTRIGRRKYPKVASVEKQSFGSIYPMRDFRFRPREIFALLRCYAARIRSYVTTSGDKPSWCVVPKRR